MTDPFAGRTLTGRQRIIVELLDRYDELVSPLQARNGHGDGEPLPLMPATYTASVRELERLMQRMRAERPSQWWHVNEHYIACTWVVREVPVRRKAKRGHVTELTRARVRRASPAVRAEKVRRGVQWLADEWAAPFEPMLPQELLVAA